MMVTIKIMMVTMILYYDGNNDFSQLKLTFFANRDFPVENFVLITIILVLGSVILFVTAYNRW